MDRRTCSGCESVPVPVPGPGEVLVEVAATSLNLSDWEGLVGSPAYARFGGLRRPRRHGARLGHRRGRRRASAPGSRASPSATRCTATTCSARAGSRSSRSRPESVLAHKPAGLTFAQASTIPQAGAIALQGTAGRDARRPRADQRRRRRIGILRHPAGEGGRRARDGGRQRRQARLHALARRRRRDRLSRRGLHATAGRTT